MASISKMTPLSKKEQQEEEMRKELQDVGLYYETMDLAEMKQLIYVLNESKKESRKRSEDTIDAMIYNQLGSSQDTSKNTESTIPLPSFSYRQEAASGMFVSQNSTLEESKSSNGQHLQASSSSNSFEKNFNSPDSEPIYDKNSNFKKDEDYPALGSRYSTRSKTGARSQDTKKLSLTAAKKASLERWSLDPLEFSKEKNSIPLCQSQQSESNFEKSWPYCSEEIDFDSEEFDKLCEQMNAKLSTYNNKCIVELGTKNKKSAPIKINLQTTAGSKVPVKDNSFTINNEGSSTPARNERASKRKALSTIAAATIENDENSSGDEFSNTKKRKFQQGKKEEEGVRKNQENQKDKNVGPSMEVISIDDFKDNLDIEFDNSNLHNIRRNSNTKVSTENGSDVQQSQYPRRIEPPNPYKKNYKGPRAKRKNSTLIQNQPETENKKILLNDEEISKTLRELDEQIDDNDCVDITDDIKPPSTPKRLTKKLQIATNHLENIRELEVQKLKAEEEAKEQKEKEERLKKDEIFSSRLQEQENEEGRRLESQRKLDQQSAFYKNILNNKQRVTRSTFQSKKTEEEMAEDLLLDGDDDEPTITKIIEKHLCPICQKPFPADIIETHASGCDSYAPDFTEAFNKPSTSRRFADLYKCHFCDNYETRDGNLYEDHVASCKTRSVVNGGWMFK